MIKGVRHIVMHEAARFAQSPPHFGYHRAEALRIPGEERNYRRSLRGIAYGDLSQTCGRQERLNCIWGEFVKKRVYLDNCCFNRPYDNQRDLLIRLETEAKLEVQQKIETNELELIWSFMLDYENAANPFDEKRDAIQEWRNLSATVVQLSSAIHDKAAELLELGLREKDATHIACAISANADYFVTTDKKILNKLVPGIMVVNPIDFIRRYCDV